MQKTIKVQARYAGPTRVRLLLGIIGVALFGSVISPQAAAQNVEPYVYARPGRPTITLYVWGSVSRPGIWHVEQDASLIEVLSVVNPNVANVARDGMTVRQFLRIYRGGEGTAASPPSTSGRELIFDAPLGEVLATTQPAPALRHGDILAVETEARARVFTLRNISSVIGTAASLTLLIIRLSDL